MKKILIVLAVLLAFSSCRKLEDLNKNIKDPTAVSGESLFTGAQKTLFDQMVSANVNFNIWRLIDQYWSETTYTDESNYDLVTRSIPDNHWNTLYRDVLEDLSQSMVTINATTYPNDIDQAAQKKNRIAQVKILYCYTFGILVETFGNIPYTQALNIANTAPAYDDGKTIYEDLITQLNSAMADINTTYPGIEEDNMYQGDMSMWIKFANSLKLRMGMLLSDCDAPFAKTTVEAAASDLTKLISTNGDNARLVYLAAQPNANPIYNDLVASGRKDFVACKTIVDTMNNWADPRLPFYFTQIDTSSVPGTVKLAFVGGPAGASNDYTRYSHVADAIQEPTFEGLIFDAAEVEFLLAQAVERGYSVSGTAEDHYKAGITLSMSYWGVTAADIQTYLAQPGIAYTTAPGDWKQKIGMQMWLSYYNRGFEAWTAQRLLDFPALVAPADALTVYPVRYTYPVEEQTLNGTNWSDASNLIGGDDVGTRLFWDTQKKK
jgi:hypothetical protein